MGVGDNHWTQLIAHNPMKHPLLYYLAFAGLLFVVSVPDDSSLVVSILHDISFAALLAAGILILIQHFRQRD